LADIKVQKIEHLGIAVNNVEEALEFYHDSLGLGDARIRLSPKYKTVFLDIGDSEVELLQDLRQDGIIAQYIRKRGEGIQHVALTVSNLEMMLAKLHARGIVPMIDSERRDSPLVAWLHPRYTHGVLVELCDNKYKEEREKPFRRRSPD